jgi:hypothetical protein
MRGFWPNPFKNVNKPYLSASRPASAKYIQICKDIFVYKSFGYDSSVWSDYNIFLYSVLLR